MLARRTLWCETEETAWFGQASERSRSSEALLVHVVNAGRDNRLRRHVIACVFIRRFDKKDIVEEDLRCCHIRRFHSCIARQSLYSSLCDAKIMSESASP